MKRIGVFGGTFNPVHNGHIKLAQTYIDALSLDRLLVIPTHLPPHKTDAALIDGAARLEMCRLAFAGNPICAVDDMELRRPDKSYTADTLEALRERFPDDERYLIMGSDMFDTLLAWRRWERIFELAIICVGAREPGMRPALEVRRAALEEKGARCVIVDLEPVPVSSTEVRRRVCAGQPLGGMVPDAVAAYIVRNRLYSGLDQIE